MSFPATPLTVLVELALGADVTADPGTWSWTNVTSYIYTRDNITITRGRADRSAVADTSSLTMTADNRDGRWSTRNPLGAWYGSIRKGTPVRVSAEGHVRFTGFLSSLPPRWDVSGRDRYAPLEAKGLLYRLGRSSTPIKSPLRRSITFESPTAYWPCEDGENAARVTSVYPGGSSLQLFAPAAFDSDGGPLGSSGGVNLTGDGYLAGPTGLASASVASWEFDCVVIFDTLPSGNPFGNEYVIARFTMPNSAMFEAGILVATDPGPIGSYFTIYTIDAGGTGAAVATAVSIQAGATYHLRFVLTSGSPNTFSLAINGTVYNLVPGGIGTLMTPTFMAINQFVPATFDQSNPSSISHMAIWAPARGSDTTYLAANGYDGELAHARFGRLCDEDGIVNTTSATESQAMGPQGIDAFLNIVRQPEASDQGYLYEGLDFGLVFQSHTERENLTAALALNYTTRGHVAPPLDPTDDDGDTINDAEVVRDGGSSSRLDSDSAPDAADSELSIQNIGRRDDSQTYSLHSDEQTYQLAGWRLHAGTVPGYRFPAVTLDFAAGPSLIAGFCAADLAFLLTITNVPADIGPADTEVIVEGYQETLGPFEWKVSCNCSLYAPWKVFQLANTSSDTSGFLGRLDPDSSTLHASVTNSATSWSVVPGGARWTTDSDDFTPNIPLTVEGEQVNVSNIVDAASFVSVGTAAHANNASVTPGLPAGAAAGDLLMIFAAIRNSGAGTVNLPAGYSNLLQSANYRLMGKVHSGSESAPTVTFSGGVANADTSAQMCAFRGMATGLSNLGRLAIANQSNASAQDIAYPMLDMYSLGVDDFVELLIAWKQDDWTSVAPPSGFTEIAEPSTTTGDDQGIYWAYRIRTARAIEPPGSIAVTGGAAAISTAAIVAFAGLQTFTVSRSVNGIVKAHSANTPILIDHPRVLAL